MIEEREFCNEGGINGFGPDGPKFTAEEEKKFHQILLDHAAKMTVEERIEMTVFKADIKLNKYVKTRKINTIQEVGSFLKELLEDLKVQPKTFAAYISEPEQEINALLAGKTKLTSDVALKIAHVFDISPDLWMKVQNKNELLHIEQGNKEQYTHYSVFDLMKKKETVTV